MEQKNRIGQTYGIWLLDMICLIISYMIATQIRFGGDRFNQFGNKTLHYMVLVVFLLFCTVYSYFRDWNRDILLRGPFREFIVIVQFDAIMVSVSLVFVFFAQWSYILSRSVIINFAWLNVVLMYAAHCFYKRIMHRILSSDFFVSKVLVVASKDRIDDTIKRLHRDLGPAYQIIGSVSVDNLSGGDLAALTKKLIQIPFDEVFFNTPELSRKEMQPLIAGFEEMGVICRYNVEISDMAGVHSAVGTYGDYTVITYSMFRISAKKLIIKRLFDILGGLVGVVLTGILTLFIGPAIKLDSPGPVFFSQVRVGKNGRRFRIYKFRSMYKDAEARLKDLESRNEVKGLMFKMDNDPRITRVGAFLRKTSLDEFPQFWNVLKGDMSLVGTRPPTEREFEQYDEHYRRRLSMTPGLTGLWQVSGRSNIDDFDEVVRLDLQYIDNWSLTLDFKILLQTVGVVLFGRGAK
ncbi:MAG: sugar transferase [Lachnospiraceae bacterium]|nr:sugar transferase [Lachnospiraceae bacterium]